MTLKVSNNKSNGFTVVTGLILLLVVIIIGAVIWVMWRHDHISKGAATASKTNNSSPITDSLPTGKVNAGGSTKTYTYPGNYFKLSYPATWTLTSQPTNNGGPFLTELGITPPDAPALYAGGTEEVSVIGYQSISLENAAALFATTLTPVSTQLLTINGYRAIFQQYAQSPSLNNESYTDDIYAVTNGDITVDFYFRVNESAMPAAGGLTSTPAFNESNLLPVFNSIVASIRF